MFRFVSACLAFLFATAASAQIQFPPDSRLKAITSTKTIKIAYRADARPFSFVNDKKEPVGFTIDLCKLVANSIGQQFGLGDLKIDWVPTTLQDAIYDGCQRQGRYGVRLKHRNARTNEGGRFFKLSCLSRPRASSSRRHPTSAHLRTWPERKSLLQPARRMSRPSSTNQAAKDRSDADFRERRKRSRRTAGKRQSRRFRERQTLAGRRSHKESARSDDVAG